MAFSVAELEEELLYIEEKLDKAISHLSNQLVAVRAGRANPQILNKIAVDYYGAMTPLNQMANITVPEARLLAISLYDASMVNDVCKAISASDIGINPTNDGKIIRLAFPQLTAERRKDLGKQVKKMGEDTKVILRNERRDGIDKVKKLKKELNISEDEVGLAEKEIQKLLDRYVESVDKQIKEKEAEILEI